MLYDIELGLFMCSNDGGCDCQGCFVFGILYELVFGVKQVIGGFWWLDVGLMLWKLDLLGVVISNFVVFSFDGGMMYFCDLLSWQIYCCDYGDMLGLLYVFVVVDGDVGELDGFCVDVVGNFWNVQWGCGCVVCYGFDGVVCCVLFVLVSQFICVVFGGLGLDMLYVMSVCEGFFDVVFVVEFYVGVLFCVDVGVQGLFEFCFVGCFGVLIVVG